MIYVHLKFFFGKNGLWTQKTDFSDKKQTIFVPQNRKWSVYGLKSVKNGPVGSTDGLQCFPITQNMGFDTRTMSVACSEAELFLKLGFHFWKSSLTSYSPFILFLTFRSIWGSSKWSQMIPHIQNHWIRHPNQLYSPFCPLTPKSAHWGIRAKLVTQFFLGFRGFFQG